MGTDTKRISKVGGGWLGRTVFKKAWTFKTALLDQESTGMIVSQKVNQVSKIQRIEKTDQQRRRTQGYRGL